MDNLYENLFKIIGVITVLTLLLDHLLWKFVLWYAEMKLAMIKASKAIAIKEKQLEE